MNYTTNFQAKLLAFLLISFCFLFNPSRVLSQNMLCDHGFDSILNIPGHFPDTNCWHDHHINQAGAAVDGAAGHYVSSPFSLHVYTGVLSTDTMSGPAHTPVSVVPGSLCHGECKICTPSGFPWLSTASARVRLTFSTSSGAIISYADSPLYTIANTTFTVYSVNSTAPAGASQVTFSIFLAKPHVSGQATINVDETILTISPAPPFFSVQPSQLAFGAYNDTIFIRVDNTGGGALNYQLLPPSVPWLNVPNITGTLGTSAHKYLRITLNRSVLPNIQCNRLYTTMKLIENGDTVKFPVSVSTPCGVPNAPSIVTISGTKLMVRKRMSCGGLTPSMPYTIKGASWSPASVETLGTAVSRRTAMKRWAGYDAGMISGANANTVYTFVDFGLTVTAYKAILDSLYENGLMVIVTTDLDGNYDTVNLKNVVNAFKNHPAILMWAIGNEWNINLYHNYFSNLQSAAQATETAAKIIHSLDTLHPVASIYGDISIAGQNPSTSTIVNSLCPHVNIWGLNIYRGNLFYGLWSDWSAITTKPMFLSEFGVDSFHTTSWNPLPPVGSENQIEQRDWNHSLWQDLLPQLSAKNGSKQCVGGLVFSWSDEWWKVSPSGIQNTGGFYTSWNIYAFPDSFSNEEYFGLTRIDSNVRITKLSYGQFVKDFKDSLQANFFFCDSVACVLENKEFSFYDISSGSPSLWSWDFGDGATSTLPNPKHVYQTSGYFPVSLTVTDSTGISLITKINCIHIIASEMLGLTITSDLPVCQGSVASFTAFPSNPALVYQFQWQVNGIIQGGNSSVFQTNSLINGDSVKCIATATSGDCLANNPVTSNTLFAVINAIPATPVITQSGNTLYSNAPTGNQWYTGSGPIPGATDSTFVPTQTGTYYVVVTLNGCSSAPSNSINIVINDVPVTDEAGFTIYPVPSTGRFTVSLDGIENPLSLSVIDHMGKIVMRIPSFFVPGEKEKIIRMDTSPPGMYMVLLYSKDRILSKKILVSR